jgi:lauroyl/myristoyl acyltransferase
LHQFVATILIIFLILVPYFAFRSLGDIVGDKMLVRLFFERRRSA